MLPEYYKHEIYHHGVKGMKWGVRRYQNQDGSLKPAGKKRYDNDSDQKKVKIPYRTRLMKGRAGPGVYVGTKNHRLSGAKKDLAKLDRGDHLSIGLTKNRQAQLDARDRRILEKKIEKLEGKNTKSSDKGEKTFETLKKGANALLDKADRDNFFNSDSIFSEESMKRQSRIDRTRDAINNLDYKTLTSPGAGKKLVDTGKQFLRDSLDDADSRSFFNDDWDTMMSKRDRNDFFRDLLDD